MRPLLWRVPPWQPAALFLVTSALAGWILYADQSPLATGMATVFAALTFGAGVLTARMALYADDDGVAVRRLWRETWVPWPEVADVEVVDLKHGNSTLQILRVDGHPVTVPASLLQPSRPTKAARARAMLGEVARQLRNRRPADR